MPMKYFLFLLSSSNHNFNNLLSSKVQGIRVNNINHLSKHLLNLLFILIIILIQSANTLIPHEVFLMSIETGRHPSVLRSDG